MNFSFPLVSNGTFDAVRQPHRLHPNRWGFGCPPGAEQDNSMTQIVTRTSVILSKKPILTPPCHCANLNAFLLYKLELSDYAI